MGRFTVDKERKYVHVCSWYTEEFDDNVELKQF